MQSDKRQPVGRLLSDRRQVVELISIAVIVAAGVNLVTGAIAAAYPRAVTLMAGVGAALVALGAGYAVGRLRALRHRTVKVDGFILYDPSTNALVGARRYELSEHVASYMQAAFTEDVGLRGLWNHRPLRGVGMMDLRAAPAMMVTELLEYIVIEKLSLQLGEPDEAGSDAVALRRDDVPDVLVKNRFLELFSRPLDIRPALADRSETPPRGEVVAVYGPDGMFHRFQLVLPKGTVVRRQAPGHIRLATGLFDLEIQCSFDGFSCNLPSAFEEHYLGREIGSLNALAVQIEVTAKFKARAFITLNWRRYEWVDEFLDELADTLDSHAFFRRIQWDAAVSVIYGIQVASSRSRRHLSPSPDG